MATVEIDSKLAARLSILGIITNSNVRQNNAGVSDYSKHLIQPWSIWKDYNLNAWDADIIKRVLRNKGTTSEEQRANRRLDYQKIIHICKERLRQLDAEDEYVANEISLHTTNN